MLRAAAELARHAVGWIYPNACLVCDTPEVDGAPLRHGLCSECFGAAATDPHLSCPRCAHTVGPHTDAADGCRECRPGGFAFDRAVRLGPHTGKLRDAVLRIKLPAGEGLADQLGDLLADARAATITSEGVTLVAPVPLHWWRRWARGYNQAEALARPLAAALGVPFDARLLRRVRWATQHAQPTRAARRANIASAFRVRSGARLSGKTVLVVDDVMTTGSTLDAVARVLKDAGAARVVVAVLARRDAFR